MRAPFPWLGGKSKLLWIIDELAPYDYNCFVDVFGGGGTVTFNRPTGCKCPVIYNDLDGDLTNFMVVLKHRPLALLDELDYLPLHSRQTFEMLCEVLDHGKIEQEFSDFEKEEQGIADQFFIPEDAETVKKIIKKHSMRADVVRAAAYFKQRRFSFNGTGKSVAATSISLEDFYRPALECSLYLQEVFIENMDFEQLMKSKDRGKVFFYCDPPYMDTENRYKVAFTMEDHRRLYETVCGIKGYVMLSYGNHPEIVDMYKEHFFIFLTERADSLSQKEGKKFQELIITNYDPFEFGFQMKLPGHVEGRYALINEPKDQRFIKKRRNENEKHF